MRIPPVRRGREAAPPPAIDARGARDAVQGAVRVDRSTEQLLRRLVPGDVAVLDHLDLDRATAEALVARRPAAVVNASATTSGRYPALGAGVLVAAGVRLVDGAGRAVMSDLPEGSRVRVEAGRVVLLGPDGERVVAQGAVQTAASVAAAQERARPGLAVQLESLVAGAAEQLQREHALLLDGAGLPRLSTPLRGREVVVVARAGSWREDLRALRPYLRDHRPVLVGVDAGADAVLEAGHRLDVVVGDLAAVSERALTCGAELVAHVRPGAAGRRGPDRARALGADPLEMAVSGTSADAALLLAGAAGASVVVAVGAPAALVDLLDRGRAGMAGALLTRLRLGGSLVDARSVARLHRPRISEWQLAALVLAALLALGAAMATTTFGQTSLALVAERAGDALGALDALGPRPAGPGAG